MVFLFKYDHGFSSFLGYLWRYDNRATPVVVRNYFARHHNSDVMSTMASQINTGVTIVYSTDCSGAGERKHQSSAPLAFVRGIHGRPVNSPHKGPVTQKTFSFDDVIIPRSVRGFLLYRLQVDSDKLAFTRGQQDQSTRAMVQRSVSSMVHINKAGV